MQEDRTSPAKKQRVADIPSPQEQALAAHEWTGNAAVINNVVRFLPTGQDVLRCELVNSTWHSSTTCPALPSMHLSSQALIKASPACLWRNARRLATLRAAFAKEPNTTDGGEERAINKAAVELLEASATNLVSLTIDDLGRRLQDSPWGRLTSLTRLQLNNSGSFSLPSGLGTLTGLQHLSINNFTQITNLAYLDERVNMRIPWVQQLTNLTSLSVTRTNRFFNIGGHLPTSLQELDLDVNPVFEALPDSVSQVTGLRSVTLSGLIANLPEGLGSLPQLSRLCFNKCDSLRWLPDKLLQSTSIHSVSIICNTTHRNSDTDNLPFNRPPGYLGEGGLQRMPAITSLAISLPCSSYFLDGLVPTASLSCLTQLQIYQSPVLLSTGERGLESSLAGMTALRCLQLSGIPRVESVDSIAALTALTSLALDGLECVVALPSFEQLGLLQQLVLKGCSKVKVLLGVQGSTSLQQLRLQDMMSLGSLPAELGELTQLQELVVYFCPCVRKFPASLQQLQLRLLSIGSLNERCAVARKLVASAKARGAFRYPTELGLAGVMAVGGSGAGGAL